jgi:hypothetical protein
MSTADVDRRAVIHQHEQGTWTVKLPLTIDPRYHDAVLFDLDGVVTDTASIHSAAWASMFDDYLSGRPADQPEDHSHERETIPSTLSTDELTLLDAYWRAANYLSVSQIYLLDNPLLRDPLAPGHIKPRLLGHWGTTPGLILVYAHLNRIIRDRDVNVIYITGPGHGGPGLVANAYLEGTYSEVYSGIEE